jgi:RNA polymerase sigma-54 factor
MDIRQSAQLQVKMTMTPELQQSVHILHLSGVELLSYLQEQALDNPLLELEWEGVSRRRSRAKSGGELSEDPLWRLPAKQRTLEQSLLSQLRMNGLSNEMYRIAAFIVGSLNEAGYLTLSEFDIASCVNKPQPMVVSALQEVQQLEPTGVGARDLRECLLLQISKDRTAPSGAYEFLEHWFPLIVRGKWDEISRNSRISMGNVRCYAAYIQTLQPRPGHHYPSDQPQYVVPDAEVYMSQGEIVIRWNPVTTPRLSLLNYFDRMDSANEEAVNYVRTKRKGAEWLVRALEQRYRTLKRVIQAICEEQTCFWESGANALKPLNLKTVAEKLQMHESTVSRAVNGKYIRTIHGTFELKFFFSAVQLDVDGEAASSMLVKSKIAELIAHENKLRPFSDQQIVEELLKQGFKVARRTVAKYREELQILSSSLRKRIV